MTHGEWGTARRPRLTVLEKQAVLFSMAKLAGIPRAVAHRLLWAAVVVAPFVVMTIALPGCGSGRAETTRDSPASAAPPISASDANSAKPKPLPPGAKTVALEKAGDRPYDKTFDDIRFDIKPGQPFHREMLPPEIESLTGQRIRIRGYILPTPQRRGIKQFVLVRDNQECCFGPGAALYDCILVEMQGGATAEYSIRPIAVEGTFDVQEVMGLDGKHLAIYHLSAESVR
jgi:hypothetical protein